MNIRFDQPELLWLLLLALPMAWLGHRSLAAVDPGRRWTALGLRVAVLVVLTLMLAGLAAVRWMDDLTVVAVIDRSESVRRFVRPPDAFAPPPTPVAVVAPKSIKPAKTGATAGKQPATAPAPPINTGVDAWLTAWVSESSKGRRVDDRLGVVTFDGRPTVRSLPSITPELGASTIEQPRDGTDIAEAIRQAISMPAEGPRRIVLLSDGRDNTADGGGSSEGEILAAAREAASANIRIDVVPLDYRLRQEVMVDGLYTPAEAHEGQTVTLRTVLRATQPTPGKLFLRHDGQVVEIHGPGKPPAIQIRADSWIPESDAPAPGNGTVQGGESAEKEAGKPGAPPESASPTGQFVRVVNIEMPMDYAGVNRFEALFEPDKGFDTLAANNRAESFTLVRGASRVLFVDAVGGDDGKALPRTLRGLGMLVDVLPPTEAPSSLADFLRYDAVVFQDVPAESINASQQEMLAKYVTEMGGGLLVVGGPNSFGAGGWTNTPIDRIMPVDCKIPTTARLPVGCLMLVIDRSGSMSERAYPGAPPRLDVAVEAAVLAVSALHPQDLVGLIAFDFNAELLLVPTPVGPNREKIVNTLRHISYGGGTSLYKALEGAYLAFQTPEAKEASAKHLIFLTDGDGEGGDYAGLLAKMRAEKITVTTIGIGVGEGGILSWIAEQGKGTFYPVDDPSHLPQIFIKETRTVRRTLIKEKPFLPRIMPTGSPILEGFVSAPSLNGLVMTGPKRDPSGERLDPRVFTPLLGPDGEPLFAHWQIGLGRTAAFTSDATTRWAADWLHWGRFADFWGRTLRLVARPPQSVEIDTLTTVRQGMLHVRLDASGIETGEPAKGNTSGNAAGNSGGLSVVGSVLRPDGSVVRMSLRQTGPTLYEGELPAGDEGNYIVSLLTQDAKGHRTAIVSGATRNPGAELRRFSSNTGLLRQIAAITGGRELDPLKPEAGLLFDRAGLEPTPAFKPLWRPLLVLLLVLFLMDVAARRVAWDFARMAQSLRLRTSLMSQQIRGREAEAQATLATLRARAEQAQRGREVGEAPAGARAGSGAAPITAKTPQATRQAAQAASATTTATASATRASRPPVVPATAATGQAARGKSAGATPAPPPDVAPLPPVSPEQTKRRLLDTKRRLNRLSHNPDAPPASDASSGPLPTQDDQP
ncbi:MAG: VWA domain-containing protein [Planctomycetota bacterium]|nr:VWA domain-containing protein [Planctomycetota bacterium]